MTGEREGGGRDEAGKAEKDGDKKPEVKPEVLEWLEPSKLAFRWDGGTGPVSLTLDGDRTVLRVFAAYAFPQNDQARFVEVFEGKADGTRGDSAGMLRDPEGLAAPDRAALEECLRRGYLVPRIRRILEIRDRLHLVCWRTETDRGPREFDVDDVYKNIILRENKRVVITDIHENRYEIPDYHQLDPESRALLAQYV